MIIAVKDRAILFELLKQVASTIPHRLHQILPRVREVEMIQNEHTVMELIQLYISSIEFFDFF